MKIPSWQGQAPGRGFLVLLGAVLVSGLIMETILRIFFPVYSPEMKDIWVPHPVYGTYHTPGRRSLHTGYGFSTYVEANRDGFREREFTPKSSGKKRILFLGDSFTEGAQVDVEKTFPRIVESILNRDTAGLAPGPAGYECFNLAIQGHGTGQEYLIFRDYADTIQPDVVILNFFINNDVWDNSYYLNYNSPQQGERSRPLWKINGDTMAPLPAGRHGGPAGLVMVPYNAEAVISDYPKRFKRLSLWRKSYFRNFIYDVKYKMMYNFRGREKIYQGTLNNLVYAKNYDRGWHPALPGWDEAWEITRRLIIMIRDQAARRGCAFVFVYIPDQIELYHDRLKETVDVNPNLNLDNLDLDKPWRMLQPFLAENRIDYINLRDTLRSDSRRLYFKYDAHFNEDGHRVAAAAIAAKLKEITAPPVAIQKP